MAEADWEDIVTNARILYDGGVEADLLERWLQNGTHLANAIAIMRLGVNLNLLGTSRHVGDFTSLAGATPNEIVSRVPRDAMILPWKPDSGRIEKGMKFGWTDANRQDWEIRMHEPDPEAPAGTNAARGWVLRVRRGRQYIDGQGKFHRPASLFNHRSPYYNPTAANDTHIPIQPP